MNYNDYNSDDKDNGFDFSLIFTDKKYRARAILVGYVFLFLVLIFFLRVNLNKTSSNNVTENNNVLEDNENPVVDDEDIQHDEEFDYIMSNNYEFEFTIYSDDGTFVAKGKRYDDKYDFDLTDGNSVIEYLAIGNSVSAEIDGEYYDTNLPYYYINYFDNENLYKIIAASNMVEEDVYEISNEKLYNYLHSSYKKNLTDKDLVNEIRIIKKNNFVIGIEFDLTNIINSLGIGKTKSTKVALNYSNFNLIDDFEVIL